MPYASKIVGAACPRPSCPSGIAKEISDCELECTACGARFGVKPGTTTEYRNRYAGLGHMRPHVGIANMQDLREVAQHSPLVAMHLRIWEQGGFPSLEAALVSLAVHQGRAALSRREAGVGWSSNQDLARDVVEKFDRGQVISIKDPYGDAYGAHPEAVVPPAGVPVIMPEL